MAEDCVSCDNKLVLIELRDILPESKITPRFRDEKTIWILDTQVARVVPIYLSLVQVLVANTISRKWVFDHHLLWNLVLEIVDLVLIHEVVKLVVHATNDEVLRLLVSLTARLEHGKLNVFVAVPGSHDQNIFLVVFCHNLDHVSALDLFNFRMLIVLFQDVDW